MLNTIIAITGICLTFYMNFSKFNYIFNLKEGNPYIIFPWQNQSTGQTAKSSHEWISNHLFISLMHTIITGIWLIFEDIRIIHIFLHILFCLIILPNVSHFGNKSVVAAVLINLSAVCILTILLAFDLQLPYFLVLLTPVEFGVYIYSTMFFAIILHTFL